MHSDGDKLQELNGLMFCIDIKDEFSHIDVGCLFSHPPHIQKNTPQEVKDWCEEPQFNMIPLLAIGARVIATSNLSTDIHNVPAGSTGIVVEVTLQSSPEQPQVVVVQFDRDANTVPMRVKKCKRMTFFRDEIMYHKYAHPLQLAYAISSE